ncbi:MAG: hypothetical protein K2I63_00950, partial [Helicobacter sp.]|nr:hypothetical protein [Helicobacter sp.]
TKELLLEKLDSFYMQIKEKRKSKQESINRYSKREELNNGVKSDASSYVISGNDALLEEKIQEVLRRYTQEIKAIMLDHFRG